MDRSGCEYRPARRRGSGSGLAAAAFRRRPARGGSHARRELVLPTASDERSKELMREFGRLNADDVRRDLQL